MPDARWRAPSAAALTGWVAWAALTVLALAAVVRSGRNVPLGPDWRIVPAVTGHEPEPVHWLWYQDGNDRRPAGRALAWAVVAATQGAAAAATRIPASPVSGSVTIASAVRSDHRRVRSAGSDTTASRIVPASSSGTSAMRSALGARPAHAAG